MERSSRGLDLWRMREGSVPAALDDAHGRAVLGGSMNEPCPCLCGHAAHLRETCSCGCVRYCPDYIAAAEAAGQPVTTVLKDFAAQARISFGWVDPAAKVECVCAYCGGTFKAARKHAKTCSGACRIALFRALKYEHDADVPSYFERREVYSAERELATGTGTMTPGEQLAADKRVRAEASAKNAPTKGTKRTKRQRESV